MQRFADSVDWLVGRGERYEELQCRYPRPRTFRTVHEAIDFFFDENTPSNVSMEVKHGVSLLEEEEDLYDDGQDPLILISASIDGVDFIFKATLCIGSLVYRVLVNGKHTTARFELADAYDGEPGDEFGSFYCTYLRCDCEKEKNTLCSVLQELRVF